MEEITCNNLDETIDQYKKLGYRLDMIFPADAPREAILSEPPAAAGGLTSRPTSQNERRFVRLILLNDDRQSPATAGGSDWQMGRAGMEYRDLIPGRLGGKVIASHIRLTKGGEVPDYVHYHKVRFQMIFCVRGAIKVLYEDQGGPIWLHPGDCVLQPPEIRHRVLWAEAGSEVVELGMPAVHETWVEHEITLPTAAVNPERIFNGQNFVHHIAAESEWQRTELPGFEARDTGISSATRGFADVSVLRAASNTSLNVYNASEREFVFYFVLKGGVKVLRDGRSEQECTIGGSFVVSGNPEFSVQTDSNTEILRVSWGIL